MLQRQKLILPEAQLATNYGMEITQVPVRTMAPKNNSKTIYVTDAIFMLHRPNLIVQKIMCCNVIV